MFGVLVCMCVCVGLTVVPNIPFPRRDTVLVLCRCVFECFRETIIMKHYKLE